MEISLTDEFVKGFLDKIHFIRHSTPKSWSRKASRCGVFVSIEVTGCSCGFADSQKVIFLTVGPHDWIYKIAF